MIVGFTGTQNGLTLRQRMALADVLKSFRNHPTNELHHGDCVGADAEAHDLALFMGYDVVIHPPDNPTKRAFKAGFKLSLPARPYLERNHDIVDVCEVLIVCPKELREMLRSGTWATYRYAKKMQRKLVIVWANGTKTL